MRKITTSLPTLREAWTGLRAEHAAETEAAPARANRLTSAGTPPVAAACQVALSRKRGGYLAQRHPARLQLLGQRHDIRPVGAWTFAKLCGAASASAGGLVGYCNGGIA